MSVYAVESGNLGETNVLLRDKKSDRPVGIIFSKRPTGSRHPSAMNASVEGCSTAHPLSFVEMATSISHILQPSWGSEVQHLIYCTALSSTGKNEQPRLISVGALEQKTTCTRHLKKLTTGSIPGLVN